MTVLEMDGASRDFGTRHLRVTALDRVPGVLSKSARPPQSLIWQLSSTRRR